MSSVINYSKSDRKVLELLSDASGNDPVSTEGFDQHLRKAVIKLQKAGIVDVDDLTSDISLACHPQEDQKGRATHENNVEVDTEGILSDQNNQSPRYDQRGQDSRNDEQPSPDTSEALKDGDSDVKQHNSHNNFVFWFDDGLNPPTCARDYVAGQRCDHLRLGVFGRKSVCSKFNHRLDAEGNGFTPCPPCLNCRTSDQ